MLRVSFALVFAAALVPFVTSGCLPDDDATPAAGDAADLDGNVPLPRAPDSGMPDATLRDAAVPDAPVPDATLPDGAQGDDGGALADTGLDAPFDTGPLLDAGTANVRLVNLVPDLVTAVDVCAAVQGAPLQGPFLKLAGVSAGLAYGEMTQYVAVPVATHVQIRVVAANAADCSTPLVADVTSLPITIADRATVALMGTSTGGAHAPTLQAFHDDDLTTMPATGARIRVVHAAPLSAATDLVLGAGAHTFPQQSGVAYGAATAATTAATGAYAVDGNGYFIEPLFTAQVTAKRASTDLTSFVAYLSHGVSAFFVGLEGSGTRPLGFVSCDDTATPVGFKVPCTLRTGPPTSTQMRVLHVSPDDAALDICVRVQGASTPLAGPLLLAAGVTGGVQYKQLTGNLGLVPTDTSLETRYVPAGQPCTTTTPIAGLTSTYFYGQPGVTEQTLVLAQSFAPLGYGADAIYTSHAGVGDAGIAAVAYAGMVFSKESSTTDNVDVLVTPEAGAPVPLFQNLPPLATSSFTTVTPGVYSLRIAENLDGGTVLTQSGVGFGKGEAWLLLQYDTSAAGTGLVRCNLGQPDGGVAGCVP